MHVPVSCSVFNHNIKLTEEQKYLCEGNITFKECAQSLKLMTNGKSPGSDGYTVDFYKFFWEDIGPLLYRSLYLAYESGSFTDFQYQGVITCIPKEGKDRHFIGNWRPISLLNTDLKIASAVIANRIKPLLPFIISDTQKGFIKGRFIGENTRLLYDLMHYLEQHNKTGLLLLVDFEKAFDSVEWKFLKKALSSFNFGPSVCKWFELFYSKAKSCVINNGHMSNFFSLERGCRQGDPLSPYLFIIGVELLSLKLKANQDIHGIIINEVESLISLYADDTFLILDGSENSLREALECFESFYKVSGLKMNSSKTKAVWVGNKKYSDQIICPNMKLNWSHENFRVLGIDFSLDLNCITDINFTKKIKEVKAILKSWQHRKLTLLGKITVIKTLALPKLIHLLTSLPNLPQTKINDLNSLFYKFIWNGKSDKIKRSTLIGDIYQGGLKMIDLQSFNIYLKVGWIKRLFSNLDGDWQKVLLFNLQSYGGERILTFQKEKLKEVAMKLTNPFWKDVLSSYHFAKPYTKMNTDELLSLDILNFVPVTDLNYYIRWIEHNVQYLCDLIDPHSGNFYTFEQTRNKLNTKNFLKYYSLVSNVPKYIKDHLKENCVNVNFDILSKKDAYLERIVHSKNVRFVYKDLVNAIISLPTEKFSKWEKLLNCEITNWSKYFIILKKSCRNSYLQNFQFKLLHRIIPTNSFLHKIKLKNTNLCTFCKIHDETIEHLFFDCPVTQIFLKSLSKQLKQYYKNLIFDKKEYFFGFESGDLLVNLISIIAKNYIFKCKLNEQRLNIVEFKHKIMWYRSLEQYISKKNNTILAFEKMWTPLQYIFN